MGDAKSCMSVRQRIRMAVRMKSDNVSERETVLVVRIGALESGK